MVLWPLCNCRYSRGGTLYTHTQRLQFHIKKKDFNRQVKSKKKISPHYFSWTQGYERLITQPYKLPQRKSSVFLGLVRIPVIHKGHIQTLKVKIWLRLRKLELWCRPGHVDSIKSNLFWGKPSVFFKNRRFSKPGKNLQF